MDWRESSAGVVGVDPDALGAVVDLVRSSGAVAQLCVLRGGKVVLDRSFGCGPDALFMLFSAGKPFVAVLVHLLAERGLLALDEPVVTYWPQFGGRGKDAITIRQVLQHRSGVPVARSVYRDALMAASWRWSVRALETSRPRWLPGAVPAYHVLSYGFILGEVVQRVTGIGLREVMRTELLDPLGLTDTHLGVPASLLPRTVSVRSSPTAGWDGLARQSVFNRRIVRQALIPAATVCSTGRDLARFYWMLLNGGDAEGVRVLAPATIAEARQPSSDGEVDRLLRLPIRWSQGFQLGGPGPDPTRPRPMGRTSGPRTFGHNGSNCCLGWADPDRDLVAVYLSNQLQAGLEGSPHLSDISDGLLAACH